MPGRRDLQKALGNLNLRKADRVHPFPGILGTHVDGAQTVEVDGREGFVWVRLRDDLSETIQAYNAAVSPIYGLPVLVVRDEVDRSRYRVIGRDLGRYQDWGTSAYLPRHGRQHSFPPRGVAGGGDVVWVYDRQFLPLLGHPSGTPGSDNIMVQTHIYWTGNEFRIAGLTGTVGMFDLKPTGSTSARMVMVYLDRSDGNPKIATGDLTEFSANATGINQIISYVPSIINEHDHIPISAVRLVTGTSYIGWDNIYDIRPFFTSSTATGSAGGGSPVSLNITEDSVPYGTASGGLQDASGNFQYLDSSDTLVVGGDVFSPDSTTRMAMVSTGSTVGMLMLGYGGPGAAGRAFWSTLTARGTPASPAAVQEGDDLFRIQNRGHDGSNFIGGSAVRVIATADEDYSPSSHGSYLRFLVVSTGSTIPAVETFRLRGGESQFVSAPVRVEENLWVGAFQMHSGSSSGYVLTSDADGKASWQPGGGGGGGGQFHWESGAPLATGTIIDWDFGLLASVSGTVATAQVDLTEDYAWTGEHTFAENIAATQTGSFGAFVLAAGASDGYVLTADGQGVGTWQVASGGGGSGLGFMNWDDGVPLATGTIVDWGDSLEATVSGTVVRVDVSGGVSADHSYYQHASALMEPDAIEPFSTGTFSYSIPTGTTKYLLASFQTRFASSGRLEIRDPVQPLAMSGVTLTNSPSESGAVSSYIILDPDVPSFADARDTYLDRKLLMATLPTKYIPITAASSVYPLLPGPYGAIITRATNFNFTWVIGRNNTIGYNLGSEIGDTGSTEYQRLDSPLQLVVDKKVINEVESGQSGGTGTPRGGVTYVLLPPDWGAVIDDLAPYDFRDDFYQSPLNTGTWSVAQSTVGNVAIDEDFLWLKMTGNNNWGDNGIYATSSFARASGTVYLADIYLDGASTFGDQGAALGFSDGGGFAHTDYAHAFVFANSGSLLVFEDGNDRGSVGSGWSQRCTYRLRLTLENNAAKYEIQGGTEYPPIGSDVWEDITPGTTSSSTTPLHAGATAYGEDQWVSDIRVYS